MVFFNTTNENEETKREYEEINGRQERDVLAFFKLYHPREMSPSYVHASILRNIPITSVRRAFTNLTNRGLLEKTSNKSTSPLGRPEFNWRFKPQGQPEQVEQLRIEL